MFVNEIVLNSKFTVIRFIKVGMVIPVTVGYKSEGEATRVLV